MNLITLLPVYKILLEFRSSLYDLNITRVWVFSCFLCIYHFIMCLPFFLLLYSSSFLRTSRINFFLKYIIYKFYWKCLYRKFFILVYLKISSFYLHIWYFLWSYNSRLPVIVVLVLWRYYSVSWLSLLSIEKLPISVNCDFSVGTLSFLSG